MSSGIWRTPFLEETVAYADLSTRWLLAKLETNFFLFFLFPGVYVPGTFRTRKLNETGRHQACDWMLVAFRQETHLNAGEEKKNRRHFGRLRSSERCVSGSALSASPYEERKRKMSETGHHGWKRVE